MTQTARGGETRDYTLGGTGLGEREDELRQHKTATTTPETTAQSFILFKVRLCACVTSDRFAA